MYCSTCEVVSVGDVKQYFFCPVIVCLNHAYGVRERVTGSMEEGAAGHEEVRRREERRLTVALKRGWAGWSKEFGVRLYSERLGLTGVLDALLSRDREYVPVEYKVAEAPGRVPPNHYYQLVAYALLVEEARGVLVRRGLVYYTRGGLVEVQVTPEAKRYLVERVLPRIRLLASGVLEGVRVDRRKCRGCGYRNLCPLP